MSTRTPPRPGTKSRQSQQSQPGRQAPQQRKGQGPQPGQSRPAPQQSPKQAQARTPAAPQLAMSDDAKREARLHRQSEARAAAAQRRKMRRVRQVGIISAIVIVLVGLFVALYVRDATKPGQSVPIMADRHHLRTPTEAHVAYSTDPPTSGPHVDQIPLFMVYTQPMTKELAVHGLEDGGVIINYKPDLDKATVDKLAGIATGYESRSDWGNRVIMYPYPGLSNSIVLTSWGRIDRLDTYDEARIRRFIDEYVGWDHHEGREGNRIQ